MDYAERYFLEQSVKASQEFAKTRVKPVWKTANGRLLFISEMDNLHIINCIELLTKNKKRCEEAINDIKGFYNFIFDIDDSDFDNFNPNNIDFGNRGEYQKIVAHINSMKQKIWEFTKELDKRNVKYNKPKIEDDFEVIE